jgi:tetratricopeptide (TPR) repeat protein
VTAESVGRYGAGVDDRWDVFVSYGHEDVDWVGTLVANLHRDGFEVFLDQWEIIGGDRVTGRLEAGLRGSTHGVLVISPHALSRPWVIEEYQVLLRQAVEDPGRRLIPVLYRDAALPPFIANRHWVDFRGATTGPEYDAALERLKRALRGRAAVDRPERGSRRVWPAVGDQTVRVPGPMRFSIRIGRDRVSLRDDGIEVAGGVPQVHPATIEAVRELHRGWQHDWARTDTDDATLARVGRRLSLDFLAGDVGAALAQRVGCAATSNERLELGIEAPGFEALPWETLILPDEDGSVAAVGGTPLVLHHNVALYRTVGGLGAVAAYKVRGPLRILVVIASPESQDRTGELLNYEAELKRIVDAVEPARRRGDAFVRVLTEGSLGAIRAALESDPQGFHVLHVSCHARPGELILEDTAGGEDAVSARRLMEEAIPAGTDLPMVMLAGCSTGLAARQTRSRPSPTDDEARQRALHENPTSGDDEAAGERELGGVGADLLRAGVPVVLTMQAPVGDAYATDLAGELYSHLATAATPDPLVALSEARRIVERGRAALSADSRRRRRAEWATPTLLVRGLRVPLFRRDEPFGAVADIVAPVFAEGVVVRKVGDFVGRRRELRLARRALEGEGAGLVIHAIGGVGKSTLAAEVVAPAAQQGAVVSLHGKISVDVLLDEVGARLSLLLPDGDARRRVTRMLRSADIEWSDRWKALSELLLPAMPMIVLLDNFEDNLTEGASPRLVRDPELADLLARWARRPGQSKLLITCRDPVALPDDAHRRLTRLHLGPLSLAETAKLIWQLPGLDALSPSDRVRAYRDVGGHPRVLEYLDALLRGGHARFDDVAERMEKRLLERGVADSDVWMATRERNLDATLAEAVTLAVDDVVLIDLLEDVARTPLARRLVIGASVYRVPIDRAALLWQVAEETKDLPNPGRDARMARIEQAIEAARVTDPGVQQFTPDQLGLTPDDVTAYEADMKSIRQPPVNEPYNFMHALAAAASAGLIVPISTLDRGALHVVHRWTATAIAHLESELVTQAHRSAARYWHWRVRVLQQDRSADIEQLIEARHHHHSAGDHKKALQVSDHVISQLQTNGEYGRASELCRETLSWIPDDSTQALSYVQKLGILAQMRGDYDAAEQHYAKALDGREKLGDQLGLAGSRHQMGMLAQLRGDYDTAERLYTEALDIFTELTDKNAVAGCYSNLGTLAHLRGDYGTAEQRYTEALEVSAELGDRERLAQSNHNLGILASQRGDYDRAERRYSKALDLWNELGDPAGSAQTNHMLGLLAQNRGDWDNAARRYSLALATWETVGDQANFALTIHQLGRVAEHHGDYETAERRYTQALVIWERLANQADRAKGWGSLGSLALRRGDYDAAERFFTLTLEVFERIGDQGSLALAYHSLATLAQDRRDYDTAEERHYQALEIFKRLGHQREIGVTYHALGAIAEGREMYEIAAKHYSHGVEISERLDDPDGVAGGYASLAQLMIEQGNYPEAVSYDLRALVIYTQAQDQEAAHCVMRLAKIRSHLGEAAFASHAAALLDEASLETLGDALDQFDQFAAGQGGSGG